MQKLKHTLYLVAGLIWAQAVGASDFSPIRQPADIQAAGAVQVAFTPGDDGVALIVQAIEGARKQVLVQAYSFTSRTIAQALIDAQRRGLDVQLLADPKQAENNKNNMVKYVAAAGVPTFFDEEHDSAHNKVMVIDAETSNPVVITGSFNFTQAAQFKNAENLLLFHGNPQLTAAYLRNWRKHREHARQRTEDRRQRTEERRQRTEDRRQKTEKPPP
ncbi:MAG: phospholipase D family protein [Sulfuricellaceae bacterium]